MHNHVNIAEYRARKVKKMFDVIPNVSLAENQISVELSELSGATFYHCLYFYDGGYCAVETDVGYLISRNSIGADDALFLVFLTDFMCKEKQAALDITDAMDKREKGEKRKKEMTQIMALLIAGVINCEL